MGIPEEDKIASWLRDYGTGSKMTNYNSRMGYVDTNAMLVNPTSMLDLAQKLEDEHIKDYCSHAKKVIPKLEVYHGKTQFVELDEAMRAQSDLAYNSTALFREHDFAVTKFVAFVKEMAEKYRTADADSSIRLSDVNRELSAGAPGSTAPAVVATSSTQPPASPNLGAPTVGAPVVAQPEPEI